MATLLNKFKQQKREAENSLPSFDNGGKTDDHEYYKFFNDFKKGLALENANKYKGRNPNSSAVGKYQFLWNKWKPQIKSVTGITDKTEFENNPKAQEDFFKWYFDNEVYTQAKTLKENDKLGLRLDEIGALIHFRGFSKAKSITSSGKHIAKTSINPSTNEYLNRYNKSLGKAKNTPDEDVEYDPSYENAVYNQYENMAKAYSVLAGAQVSAEDIEKRIKAENGLAGIQAELMMMEKAKEHQKEVAEANKLAEEALAKEQQEKANKEAQERQAIISAMEQQQKEREFHANAYLGTMKQDVKIDPAVFSSGGGEQQPFRFGTQMNLQNAQSGGAIKEQKDFLQSYVDSPMYKKRLESQFSTPEKIEAIQKERSERLKNAKINFTEKPIGKEFGYVLGQYVQEKAHPNQIEANIYSPVQGRFTNEVIGEGKYTISQDGSKKWKKGEIYLEPQFNPKIGEPLREYATIPIHEMGHLLDSGAKDMPLKFIANVANRVNGVKRLGEDMFVETAFDGVNWTSDNKPVGFEYTATPSEISARLQSARYMLNKNNIYDAREGVFTEEHLDKMLLDPTINELQDIKDLYKEMKGSSTSASDIDKMKNDKEARKNFIWFMNNIASNNKNTKNNYVQKGGVIQQAFEKPNLLKFKNKYNLK